MESETQDSEDRRIDQNIIDESSDSEVELPPAPRAPNQTYVNQISNMDLRFDSTIPNSPPYSPRHFQGCSLVGNYELEKKIGEGTFGEVSLARHKVSKKRVALKRILVHNEREGMPITALREIRILKRLKHPNVIRLMEMAIQPKTKERGVVFMVFPYMHHDLDGILQNPLITLTPPQIKSYMQQMLLGLEHLHYHHILHRDIKSSNILIDNRGKVKIADFGLARPFVDQPQDYTNMVVTRWYRAPELLMGSTRYTAAIDIWAIGCVFGEMLKRRAIFPGKSDMEQLDLIWTLCGTPDQSWKDKSYLELPMFRDGTIQDYQGETSRKKTLGEKFPSIHYRNETYNLLDDLLTLNPKYRPSASEALKAPFFKHGYIAKVGTADFKTYDDSHELDSRNEKMKRFESGQGKVHLKHHYDVPPSTSRGGFKLPSLKK